MAIFSGLKKKERGPIFKFLESRGLLTKAEKAALAEKGKEKHFGPDIES